MALPPSAVPSLDGVGGGGASTTALGGGGGGDGMRSCGRINTTYWIPESCMLHDDRVVKS